VSLRPFLLNFCDPAKMAPARFAQLSLSPGPTGRDLGHNYQRVRSIGRGSFGEATLVEDGDGKLCVMKTIDIAKLDKEHQLDAVNEVKVLSSLKHPYIVRYHESFIDNGTLAIVMDYAEGGDLSKRIMRMREKQQLFAEGQLLRWFTQVTLGLKYLHKCNIIHRDLKPQNIFLTKHDDLRLGDFGISKMLGGSSIKEKVCETVGTPYYLSPEICQAKLYSFASDIWASGCILFELAALHVPFEAPNIPCLIRKITSGRLPTVPPAFSMDLRQLLGDLLNRDHSRRPSAAEILQNPMIQAEMRQLLQDAPSDASSTPPLSRIAPSDAIATPPLSRNGCMKGRVITSLLQPLKPRMDLKRSPSTPAPAITKPKTLRRSGSTTLLAGNAGAKAAWGEKMPWSEMFPSKEGAIGNAKQSHDSSNKAAYWEANRGLSRTNRLFGKIFVEFDRCMEPQEC